ncbi:hypothetical protein [Peribacillus asahii]|uniref:hypothetical protein n=1 Tax=Peribacillus asahii TaxID=228899 RepID=UPI00207A5A34|nr:hypothetical protein [Peribacillus asahii]USK72634.1 hypothetical protein LIS76_23605 [Peribacillus asahii]USK72750.1 hypothetical protein LIS76_23785 [Peribacillus asahii]
MAKLNRGKTTKLSIRLSVTARQKIEMAAKNLGISLGGVILFELTKIMKNPPSLADVEELKSKIRLEPNHFVLTISTQLIDKINVMSEDYGTKKNVLIGYMVSDHFEKLDVDNEEKDFESKRIMLQVNETLKKKMIEYSEENYIPLNALVSYSVLQGPYEGFPSYETDVTEQIFTKVPEYIGQIIKEESIEGNMREHFYSSLCLFKQFMTPEGRFYK